MDEIEMEPARRLVEASELAFSSIMQRRETAVEVASEKMAMQFVREPSNASPLSIAAMFGEHERRPEELFLPPTYGGPATAKMSAACSQPPGDHAQHLLNSLATAGSNGAQRKDTCLLRDALAGLEGGNRSPSLLEMLGGVPDLEYVLGDICSEDEDEEEDACSLIHK